MKNENREQIFYKTIIEKYGFYMVKYKSENRLEDKYIAIKDNNGLHYGILITDEINENIDIYEAEQFLKNKLGTFELNVVVFLKDENDYINSNNHINKLVIDKQDNVLLCSESCVPIMNTFINLRNNNKGGKIEKITLGIIIVNIIVYLISAILSNNPFDINYGVLWFLGGNYQSIKSGEYYRLFTCMFLHGGLIHLGCNMYSLLIVGPQIKAIYGKFKYILIYAISGICASIVSSMVNPEVLSVGASGAIFGLVGALLSFAYSEKERINKEYIMELIKVIIINLIIGFTMKNIDNSAHIGGVISGFIAGYIFYSFIKSKNIRRE